MILLFVDGVIGEDVDGQIEPQARRVAAHGRRPEDHADEVVVGVLEQQWLAHALVLVVEGQWHERMIFGDVRLSDTP